MCPKGDERVRKRRETDKDMRRLILLLATIGMALLLSAGLALAATYNCTAGRACIGTGGRDTLNGSRGSDPFMDGRQNDDRLFANEGQFASLQGDAFDPAKNNTKTDGDDRLKGGPGFDEMVGRGGADTFWGAAGSDFIFAEETSKNKGKDTVGGGPGNDFILAKDGIRDTVSCGRGNLDTAFFDTGGTDKVDNNCEFRNKFPSFEELGGASTSAAGRVSPEEVNALRARY
jgi:Ca2+-binding RTX toxin-like protein